MGKRGPRSAPLRAVPGTEQIVDMRERPPVEWDKIVLREEQAAEFLKCAPQTLRRRAAAGVVPRYLVGGEYRYYVYDLLDYVLSERGEVG